METGRERLCLLVRFLLRFAGTEVKDPICNLLTSRSLRFVISYETRCDALRLWKMAVYSSQHPSYRMASMDITLTRVLAGLEICTHPGEDI